MSVPFRPYSLMPTVWLNTIHVRRPKHRRLMARAKSCVDSSIGSSEALRRIFIAMGYSHLVRCGCGPWLWPPDVRESMPEGAGL